MGEAISVPANFAALRLTKRPPGPRGAYGGGGDVRVVLALFATEGGALRAFLVIRVRREGREVSGVLRKHWVDDASGVPPSPNKGGESPWDEDMEVVVPRSVTGVSPCLASYEPAERIPGEGKTVEQRESRNDAVMSRNEEISK